MTHHSYNFETQRNIKKQAFDDYRELARDMRAAIIVIGVCGAIIFASGFILGRMVG